MPSTRDNSYNIKLLTEVFNATQLEVRILRDKIKILEMGNIQLKNDIQNLIELCQKMINMQKQVKVKDARSLIQKYQDCL